MSYSYLTNVWRQIIKFSNVDVCHLLSPDTKFQSMEALVAQHIQTLHLGFTKCPIRNGTVIEISNRTDKEEVMESLLSLPPGSYRSSILLFDAVDDKIFDYKIKTSIKANSTEKYEFK